MGRILNLWAACCISAFMGTARSNKTLKYITAAQAYSSGDMARSTTMACFSVAGARREDIRTKTVLLKQEPVAVAAMLRKMTTLNRIKSTTAHR